MNKIGKFIFAIVITLSFTGSAICAELYSPAIGSDTTNILTCTVLNVGAKNVTGTIALCGIKGCFEKCQLGELSGGILTTGQFSSCSAKSDLSGAAYCIYEIDNNPRDVRASACVTNSLSETSTCVNAE